MDYERGFPYFFIAQCRKTRRLVNNELQRVCGAADVAYFVVQLQLLFGRTNKKNTKNLSHDLYSREILERGTSQSTAMFHDVYMHQILLQTTHNI
jgi:hypothetical protein